MQIGSANKRECNRWEIENNDIAFSLQNVSYPVIPNTLQPAQDSRFTADTPKECRAQLRFLWDFVDFLQCDLWSPVTLVH